MLDEDKKKEEKKKEELSSLKTGLESFEKELKRQEEASLDMIASSQCLIVKKEGNKILMGVSGVKDIPPSDYGLTEHAIDQISDKIGMFRKYGRKLIGREELDLFARNANAFLPDEEKRMVRILDGQIRALLGDGYRVISNHTVFVNVARAMQEIIQEKGLRFKVQRADLTDRHFYIKITSPDLTGEIVSKSGIGSTKKKVVEGGIVVSNSEVGEGSFQAYAFINVLECTNGLIGERKLRKIHRRAKLPVGVLDWSNETLRLEGDLLMSELRDVIKSTFDVDIFHKWLDEINEKADTEIKKPTVAIGNIVKKYKLSKEKEEEILNQFFDEDKSQWGLAMAVTRIAQKETYEDQIGLEKIGADILKMKKNELTVEVKEE